jgi:hypothetical protein
VQSACNPPRLCSPNPPPSAQPKPGSCKRRRGTPVVTHGLGSSRAAWAEECIGAWNSIQEAVGTESTHGGAGCQVKQADELEEILTRKFTSFLQQRAEVKHGPLRETHVAPSWVIHHPLRQLH